MSNKKSTKITRETVKYVAHLARIELKDSQIDILAKQLEDILDFIDKLKEVDITNVNPTSHILPIQNVLREDEPGKSLPVEKALQNAPKKQDDFFAVPKVIE